MLALLAIIIPALAGCIYYCFLAFAYSGKADNMLVERKIKKEDKIREKIKRSDFRRINEVRGVLSVQGKTIKTYSSGELKVNYKISMSFYELPEGNIKISNIYLNENNNSYRLFNKPKHFNMEKALEILDELERKGRITRSVIRSIKEIFSDIQQQNELIKQKKLKCTPDHEYYWNF